MISTFKKSITEWVKSGKSKFAIKDSKEFTDIVTKNAREVFVNKTSQLDTFDIEINDKLVQNIDNAKELKNKNQSMTIDIEYN